MFLLDLKCQARLHFLKKKMQEVSGTIWTAPLLPQYYPNLGIPGDWNCLKYKSNSCMSLWTREYEAEPLQPEG